MTTFEKIKQASADGDKRNLLQLVCEEIDELKKVNESLRSSINSLDKRTTGLMKVGGALNK